jgi:hypothetical protein
LLDFQQIIKIISKNYVSYVPMCFKKKSMLFFTRY